MSEHKAKIIWKNNSNSLEYDIYPRDHTWHFEDGLILEASAAPEYLGNRSLVDPEQAFVASISSCHMLTFIAICSKKKIIVREYIDEAVGILEKNQDGRMSISRVILKPDIKFGSFENTPDSKELKKIHESAHKHCFIANSVNTHISIE